MAKYTVTRSCGHEEVVVLFGNRQQREYRLQNFEPTKLCYKCWQAEEEKRRAEATLKAQAEAEESGLPKLVGTEKQVAWAETIRLNVLAKLQDLSERLGLALESSPEEIDLTIRSIQAKDSAHWWIDHRSTNICDLEELLAENFEAIKAPAPKPVPVEVVKDAQLEATVRPENPLTETPAEIRIAKDKLQIVFPEKRDDLRLVLKDKLQMRWEDGCWQREITWMSGPIGERAAEAGCMLLAAGFIIRIYDPEIRAKAIAGDYEPECTRWLTVRTNGQYQGWFAIWWNKRRDKDYYGAAGRITGSRWSRPSVVVPPIYYEQVLDFAQMYRFRLSDGAQKLVEDAKRIKEETLTVQAPQPVISAQVTVSAVPPVLEIPEGVEVDDEFKD